MKKIFIFVSLFFILNINSISHSESVDCSQYEGKKNLLSFVDKWRCKRGDPEREKLGTKIKKLWPFKKKN